MWNHFKKIGKNFIHQETDFDETAEKLNDFSVDSRDVKLHYLYHEVLSNPSIEATQALQDELAARTKADQLIAELFPEHMEAVRNKTTPLPTDFECYKDLIETFEKYCMKFTDYSMKYMSALVAECEGMKSIPGAREKTI